MRIDRQKLIELNSFHFHINERTNRILCIIIAVLLILYSVVGLMMFSMFDAYNAPMFIVANAVWLAIAFVVLLKYTRSPYVVIALYLTVIATDRILSWINEVYLGGLAWEDVLEIVMAAWMFITGVRAVMGRLFSRFPMILSTAVFIILDFVFEVPYYAVVLEDLSGFVLGSFISSVLRLLLYFLLIALLLCNGNPKRKGRAISEWTSES